jgi:hypothetical protein
MNVALADPDCLSFDEYSGCLWSGKAQSWVVSSLLGRTTYFCNSKKSIRQICVIPFTHGWYRFVAVLGKVSGETALYFGSWRGGISFQAHRHHSGGLAVPGKRGERNVAPIEGSQLRTEQESGYATQTPVPAN